MRVKMIILDRNNTEVTSLEFEKDAEQNYITLTGVGGTSVVNIDPLTTIVNMILPTISTVDVPEVVP